MRYGRWEMGGKEELPIRGGERLGLGDPTLEEEGKGLGEGGRVRKFLSS